MNAPTQAPADELVEKVTRADREAAARLIGASGLSWSGDMIRDGKSDEHAYVQAFVRHRITATAALQAEVERLRKLVSSSEAERYQKCDALRTQLAIRDAQIKALVEVVASVLPSAAGMDDQSDSRIFAFYINMGELRAIRQALAAAQQEIQP